MITLEDSIEIQTPPEKVFNRLTHLFRGKEDYQSWHPDHVDLRWIKGGTFRGRFNCLLRRISSRGNAQIQVSYYQSRAEQSD